MGLFKNLFKRKKGGTFFGNLLRGVANKATGGILGNGADLARWEAEQGQKELEAAQAQLAAQKAQLAKTQAALTQNQAFQAGAGMVGKQAVTIQGVNDTQTRVMTWLKRNWWMIAVPVVLLVFLKKGGKKLLTQ